MYHIARISLFVALFVVVASASSIVDHHAIKYQPNYAPISNASFGGLAQQMMVPAYKTMMANMFELNDTSLPEDVKSLRLNLLSVRNILDVFSYAYPYTSEGPSNSSDADVFLIARNDMNDGYTYIGNFKDLNDSHVNYTYAQMVALRNICLNWQRRFNINSQTYNYPVFFTQPSTTTLFSRKKSDLSPYFWGAEKKALPTLTRTGYQNIAYLVQQIGNDAIAKYEPWLNLTEIYNADTQLEYHAYRKLVRGLNAVSSFASEIYVPGSNCVKSALNLTSNLFSLAGKIEDQITAYDYYAKYNETALMKQEAIVITNMWASLRQWCATNNFEGALACIVKSLIPF